MQNCCSCHVLFDFDTCSAVAVSSVTNIYKEILHLLADGLFRLFRTSRGINDSSLLYCNQSIITGDKFHGGLDGIFDYLVLTKQLTPHWSFKHSHVINQFKCGKNSTWQKQSTPLYHLHMIIWKTQLISEQQQLDTLKYILQQPPNKYYHQQQSKSSINMPLMTGL